MDPARYGYWYNFGMLDLLYRWNRIVSYPKAAIFYAP